MSLLLETLRIENGVVERFDYHQHRMMQSAQRCFAKMPSIDVSDVVVPEELSDGVVKCRILYDTSVRSITFERYTVRPLQRLKLVYSDTIDYSLKWADRGSINSLVAQKGDADDVIIVKNGELTDISYANIALRIRGQLFTPKNCLLKGTRRQSLLDHGVIFEKVLTVSDLEMAESVLVFNAMIGLDDKVEVKISNIL